jgi:hypothetical protein
MSGARRAGPGGGHVAGGYFYTLYQITSDLVCNELIYKLIRGGSNIVIKAYTSH